MPEDQEAWFIDNGMGRHNRSGCGTSVNDVANGVTLRCDVHRLLDYHAIVFYPAGERKYVTYIVRNDMEDYAEQLHGRVVAVPLRVSDEFLYARFAYNIISLLPRILDVSVKCFPISETLVQQQDALEQSKTSSAPTDAGSEIDLS